MAVKRNQKTTNNRSTRSTRGSPSRAGAPSRKKPPQSEGMAAQWAKSALGQIHALSIDQRLDIVGGLLIILGLLSLPGLFSLDGENLFSQWSGFLVRVLGWSGYLLPLVFIMFGAWLIFRRIERMPSLTAERILGIFLLLLTLLLWAELITEWFGSQNETIPGGGSLGSFLVMPLFRTFGYVGTFLFSLFTLWSGIILTFDLTFARLWTIFAPMREQIKAVFPSKISAVEKLGRVSCRDEIDVPENLPSEFKPITEITTNDDLDPHQNKETRSAIIQGKKRSKSEADLFAESIANPPIDMQWNLPELEKLLKPSEEYEEDESRVEEQARLIEETLELLGAPGHVVEINHGPRVTQFGVEPDFNEKRGGDKIRVRVNKVLSLADDLTMALASQSVRIQAPVPGKSYIGIEVPNNKAQPVSLMEIIESQSFRDIQSPLRFALGKDVTGRPVAANLKNMPHLLIAGTTGSGKSVCINAILCNFLLYNSPQDLRLVLVDPKRVELTGYNGIPHLLAPVVVDMDKVITALQWILREMETRYHKFSKVGARNLVNFNLKRPNEHMPHIILVIDELADLMMTAPGETESAITRLAQLARATGIHLILATQRPSTKVITGLIKANFPARIAFNVATGVDSRVILDQNGAERLLGQGDMLFKPPDMPTPYRLQGAHVSDEEIQAIVEYWRYHAQKQAASTTTASQVGRTPTEVITPAMPMHQESLWDFEKKFDPLTEEAIELVRKEGRASTTMLQRRLRIGYTRAARLIDSLEQMGIVGEPHPNTQVREVLDFGNVAPPVDLT